MREAYRLCTAAVASLYAASLTLSGGVSVVSNARVEMV